MRRYGIARYLTDEQREQAARATYTRVKIGNHCERGDCIDLGETVVAIRDVNLGVCPIGVALGFIVSPDPWEAESALSDGVRATVNMGRLRALQRFMHDVDRGRIAPDQVAAALGVQP